MEYTEEEIIYALQTIKNVCSNCSDCNTCPLRDVGVCGRSTLTPEYWEISYN